VTVRHWPWADSRGDKLKRIVASYRTALLEMAPGTCHLVDARMTEFGEGWVCEDSIDVDRFITAREAAVEFGLSPVAVTAWAREHPDRIDVRNNGRQDLYKAGSLIRYDALRAE
jgi:hypothetical protein